MMATPHTCRRRERVTGVLLCWFLVTFAGVASPAEDDESPQATARRWGVPPIMGRETRDAISPAWQKRFTGYITTRDGVRLRFAALLPPGKGPFPVILNYSGYDAGAIGGYAYVHNNTAMAKGIDRSLLERGYAVVGVNARGTGCSEGLFDFLAPTYGSDGADIVEWAAVQRWSTGAVGMANWSWAGMSQVATASERPPHLKAIAPGMALTDPRLDSWALGGVPSPGFITGWWMFLHSRWLAVRSSARDEHDEPCLEQVERNYRSAEESQVNLPTGIARHPLRDEWIESRTILNRADRIAVPVLSMEAFQDEATTVRAGYYQERLNPLKLWMVQTNGNHDLYESLQFRPILLDFFDHFVKGLSNGFEARPHVEVWQETTTSGEDSRHSRDANARAGWVISRPLLPVMVAPMELQFTSGHHLAFPDEQAASAIAGDKDQYQYPVEGPSMDLDPVEAKWGDLSPQWRSGSLAYTTTNLSRDMVIYGPASADLWVSSSESDFDVQVTLTEVRPDGQEVFVQRGWLRMSERALDAAQSTALRPWPCDRRDCLQTLVPEVPALARVEIFKVSYAFRKGSRIRLWIDAPSSTGENSFNHSALAATNVVWHDSAHQSKLVLGVLPQVTVPDHAADCGTVLMQPCRSDPMAAVANR